MLFMVVDGNPANGEISQGVVGLSKLNQASIGPNRLIMYKDAVSNHYSIGALIWASVSLGSGGSVALGATVAGSSLELSSITVNEVNSAAWIRSTGANVGVGTWRCQGYCYNAEGATRRVHTLWLRIA